MIRSFVFSQGKLVSQDLTLDLLKLVLYDEDAQIWVDVEGASEEEAKSILEGVFNFHALSIEDCVSVSERPKADDYESYFFMVIHAVDYSSTEHAFRTSELNLFIGKNYLVTYHDKPLRSIAAAEERIKRNAAAVARAPDRLTYHILDLLLDNYEPALEDLQHEFDELESMVLTAPSADILERVIRLKGEVQHLRQIVAPQRETIARLARGEFKLVRAHMLPYYRDLLDRLVRLSDLGETFRDSLTDTLQVHLNLQQMQVNRVIKVLTVLATLTVPFLAITSFYGMNIQHMPNTEWPSWQAAYQFVFGVTAVLTLGVYWILKRQKWL
jgi:magnesium transporter